MHISVIGQRSDEGASTRILGSRTRRTPFVHLVGALLLLMGLMPMHAAAATATVRVVGSATTVRSDLNLANYGTQADLVAAKNEFESFQIVVRATAGDLSNVSVALSTPLQSGANTIPDANITFYRAVDYNVTIPSDGEGAIGAWPDALIPEVDPFYGHNRAAFPVNVQAGAQLVAWVDILVPQTQVAGNYTGTVEVRDATGVLQSIPVKLTVANVTIPSTASLTNLFPTFKDRPCLAHTGTVNCGNAELNWKLHALYVRAGLDNRVTISDPGPLDRADLPPAENTQQRAYFNTYLLPFLLGTSDQVRLPGAALTTFHRFAEYCLLDCMNAWAAFAQTNGFLDKMIDYTCDEPSATALVQWCGERLSRPTTLPKLVTTHIQNVPADILPKIDILVPLAHRVQDMDMSGEPCCRGDQRPDYDGYLNAANNPAGTPPNQLWMYESNMSFGSNGPGDADWNSPYWNGWPGYAIDAPAMQARAINWLAFQYDISGELYWHSTERLATAWTNSYEQGGNGDGTLFYPGLPQGRGVQGAATYAPAIGGPAGSDIPIESIRLKRIRDGREDYELLKKLADAGRRGEALAIVERIFGVRSSNTPGPTHSITWDKAALMQTQVEQARRDLITAIVGRPQTVDLQVTQSDSPDPVAVNGMLAYTIRVTNNGPTTATNVKLVDTLPNSVNNNTMGTWPGGSCTRSGQDVTCQLGSIASGSTVVVTIPNIQVIGSPRTMSNSVTVSGAEADPNTANNSVVETTTVTGGSLAAPSSLRIDYATATSIQVLWNDNSTSETFFQIISRRADTGTWSVAYAGANTTTSMLSGLPNGMQVVFAVRACNAGGCSTWSNGLSATTLPAPPSNLRSGTMTTSSVQVLWNDNSSNEASFQIAARRADTGTWALTSVAANSTTYTLSGLPAGMNVVFVMRACNPGGCSAWSNVVSSTTLR